MNKIHKDCIKDIIELYENKIINMEIMYKKHIQEIKKWIRDIILIFGLQ
jgi:hypothetical protein